MPFVVASRRSSLTALHARFGADATIIDVTSRGQQLWVRFSPFFPHGNIPVPFSPGITAMSVEGIWQGLKVFERADIDPAKFAITSMHGIKRAARTFGSVLGHRAGAASDHLLDYATARHDIYLPSYRWVLDHCLQAEITQLHTLGQNGLVVLLDYETNIDLADLAHPLAHAALLLHYLENTWPTP